MTPPTGPPSSPPRTPKSPSNMVPLYQYTATSVGPRTWMVKRYVTGVDGYTEALIEVATDDPQVAIKAAVNRGSWA